MVSIRRRVGSTGGSILDVFVRGVLSTLSAWVIGGLSLWLGLEPGRKRELPLGLLSCYHEYMGKSSRVNMKTPKRRAAVTGDLVGVRVQPDMAKLLDDWRRKQEDLPGRPEAIRRLVELGLRVKK
jgi:hypothetical protein